MRLPNVEQAAIQQEKITAYLLSEEQSGGKAEFFYRFGFVSIDWTVMADSIWEHANSQDVVRITDTEHGRKYVIEGRLLTPDGRNPEVRSVWIIEPDKENPRLITVYPL